MLVALSLLAAGAVAWYVSEVAAQPMTGAAPSLQPHVPPTFVNAGCAGHSFGDYPHFGVRQTGTPDTHLAYL